MSNLDSAAKMFFALRYKVCGMSKLWSRETSKELKNLVDSYVRGIPSPEHGYAHDSELVVRVSRSSIFRICSKCNVPKIGDSIVVLDAVDVVYHPDRKRSVNVQPSKSVGLKRGARNFDLAIPVGIYRPACNASFAPAHCGIDAPRKDSGFLVIVQKFAQAFCSNIGVSHDAVLSLIGQKRGCVSALPRFDIISIKAA